MFYPLAEFLNAYKWYFVIGIAIYLILTLLFHHARGVINIVFGALILFFVLTHLGGVYGTMKGLGEDLGAASTKASTEYSDYVNQNIIPDENATPGEKLERAILYGLTGNENDTGERLPTSEEKDLSETLDYVSNPRNDGNDEGAAKELVGKAKTFIGEVWGEVKDLFGFGEEPVPEPSPSPSPQP